MSDELDSNNDVSYSFCKGCTVYRDFCNGHRPCDFMDYNYLCPCRQCIVKVMCTNACEEFDKFRCEGLNLMSNSCQIDS